MPRLRKASKPPKTLTRRKRRPKRELSDAYRDVTHRPLQCLVFLLPMVILYELGMAWAFGDRVRGAGPTLAAEQLIMWFFSLFGGTGYYLPGALLVAVLLGWHVASRNPWKIQWPPLAGMAGESVLWAIPLLFLQHRLVTLQAGGQLAPVDFHEGPPRAIQELLLSIGAGIYEELLFRLIIIGLLNLLLVDICGMKQVAGVAAAVIISSLLFALHHYKPIGTDTWEAGAFAFRAAAGAYLAAVFVLRGFGLAVGCHAMYDVFAFLAS